MGSNISAATLGISTTFIVFFFTIGFFLIRKWLQNLQAKVEEQKVGPAECAVCLCQVSAGENLRLLPHCNHGFHAHCVDSWLKYNPTCPLCRKRVMTLIPQNQYQGDNGVFGSVFEKLCNWIQTPMIYEIINPTSVFEFHFLLRF